MVHDDHDPNEWYRIAAESVLWFSGFYVIWLELTCVETRFIVTFKSLGEMTLEFPEIRVHSLPNDVENEFS